jgi:NADH dehydrogenase FAD-containing subunit
MNFKPSTRAASATRATIARGGVLILGGGVAGSQVARHLGLNGATIVNPTNLACATCPGADVLVGWAAELDAEARVAHMDSHGGRFSVAYADLVVAVGATTVSGLGLPVDRRGQVEVDETLRVAGMPHVWALGDCATVPNGAARGESSDHATADARLQARCLARNLRETPRPCRFWPRGT